MTGVYRVLGRLPALGGGPARAALPTANYARREERRSQVAATSSIVPHKTMSAGSVTKRAVISPTGSPSACAGAHFPALPGHRAAELQGAVHPRFVLDRNLKAVLDFGGFTPAFRSRCKHDVTRW